MRLEFLPHQHLMHDFVMDHERAGVFAGIGLSKTATMIEAFRSFMAEGCAKRMLVVAPLRVANLTWPNELKKWDQFKGLTFEHLRNTGDKITGNAQISFTNYERVQRIPSLAGVDIVCFDELTRAKSHKSERINALRPLLTPNIRRWGLTGTPRPNSLLELFAQIRLLDDGQRLSPSFTQFQNTYFEPEDYDERKWTPLAGSEAKIYEKIHDLVITLRTSDYLKLPDTIQEDIDVPLPASARGIYKQLGRELMATLADERITIAPNAGTLVGKLLQVCSGAVYSTDEENTREVSHVHDAKINALKKLLADSPKERALIACNFVHERDRICAAIPGVVDAHKFKGDIEDAWNSGRLQHLVADPAGLGHGLNMQQGGRWTIWFSPDHSRELYDQFNGRTARKGQELAPRVSRLICPGTIDDAVIETLRVRGDEQGEMMAVLTNFRQLGFAFS